jgi:hypothetical protein
MLADIWDELHSGEYVESRRCSSSCSKHLVRVYTPRRVLVGSWIFSSVRWGDGMSLGTGVGVGRQAKLLWANLSECLQFTAGPSAPAAGLSSQTTLFSGHSAGKCGSDCRSALLGWWPKGVTQLTMTL